MDWQAKRTLIAVLAGACAFGGIFLPLFIPVLMTKVEPMSLMLGGVLLAAFFGFIAGQIRPPSTPRPPEGGAHETARSARDWNFDR